MRIDFRQGIVSYQEGGFLNINPSGNVDVLAAVKPTTVSVAHKHTNYLHSEDNTINSAWTGPFVSSTDYWLYWKFDLLTFARSFEQTTIEPIAQSVEPGYGSVDIVNVTPGDAGIGSFEVSGHYIQPVGKIVAVTNSTNNDGNYTISGSFYNTSTGNTTITVEEPIIDATIDGLINLDIDSNGNPLKIEGRIWYDTSNNIHYILNGSVWIEVLIVFACLLTNGNTFISMSINGGEDFTGTQIGNTSSVLAGRVLFDEAGDSIQRDDNTFFTTEDQFFSTASRVDGIRIESNVTRAQFVENAAIAAFTPVAFVDEGKIEVGQYDATGQTVIGMLMEDLLAYEVGAVVLQGVITNPEWNWPTVGVPLWVDNGMLVPTDPHVTDPVTFPHARVPVARVLSSDSIVFEQGLGGVGDQGPPGSIDDLPIATTTDPGIVTLVTPSSDSQRAYVITDTDSRLTDARIPLPHTHPATDISFTPGSGVTSNNVQAAIEELSGDKVNIGGDTMTGFLTLHSKPVNDYHAATKNYVDQLVLGLVWLEPIDLLNMISDTVTTPPLTPEIGDAYIVPPGATGDWSTIAAGNITHWDGTIWQDFGSVTAVDPNGARFGISVTNTTSASGSFMGQDNNIALYDATGNLTGFEVPNENNAVYVSNGISAHAYTQYAFNGTDWVLMGGGNPVVVDDTTIELNSNVLSVIPATSGGTVDAATWLGINAPTTVGTNGQILSTDGTGNTLWINTSTCLLDNDNDTFVAIGYDDNTGVPCTDTGNNQVWIASGITSNIGSNITFAPGDGTLGGGAVQILSTPATGKGASLLLSDTTSFHINLSAPSSLASSTTFQLPSNNGTNGQVLTTDGTGITSWVDTASGGLNTCGVSAERNEEILVYNSASSCWNNQYPKFLRSEDNLTRIDVIENTPDGAGITVQTAAGTNDHSPGDFSVNLGNSSSYNVKGGSFSVISGNSTYGPYTEGGTVRFIGGNGSHVGGYVNILSGNGTNDSTSVGGNIILSSGSGYEQGGNVNIYSGEVIVPYGGGNVYAPSGGNIFIKSNGEQNATANSKTPGAIILQTENGDRGKYSGDEYKGRGIFLKLGASSTYPSENMQNVHIIPGQDNSSGGAPAGIRLHDGSTVSSLHVTLAAQSNNESYSLIVPTRNSSAAITANRTLLIAYPAATSGTQMDYAVLPYDHSFSRMGTIADGDYIQYILTNRNIVLYPNGEHKGQCRTAPTGDAVFEFGVVQNNNTLNPLGTVTFSSGNTQTTTSTLGGISINSGVLLYMRCVTANGITDVTIGVKGYTDEIDTTV